MTANEIYRKYLSSLSEIYERSEAAAITSMIFEHFTTITRSDIIKYPDTILDTDVADKLENGLLKLLRYVPAQYVTGKATFTGLELKVNPSVLIPRPETEELVKYAASFVNGRTLNVIDIGTGSGCIAIALKKMQPAVHMTAVEISSGALAVAQQNAAIHNCYIDFIEADFLKSNNTIPGKFDVVISNPPYIPLSGKVHMDKHVTDSEPSIALFVPDHDPLIFYRHIAEFANTQLNEGGSIFLECFEEMADEVAAMFIQFQYNAVVKQDMFEKSRMVIATRFQ